MDDALIARFSRLQGRRADVDLFPERRAIKLHQNLARFNMRAVFNVDRLHDATLRHAERYCDVLRLRRERRRTAGDGQRRNGCYRPRSQRHGASFTRRAAPSASPRMGPVLAAYSASDDCFLAVSTNHKAVRDGSMREVRALIGSPMSSLFAWARESGTVPRIVQRWRPRGGVARATSMLFTPSMPLMIAARLRVDVREGAPQSRRSDQGRVSPPSTCSKHHAAPTWREA